jgi:nucleoside-diphosphate-sugar epimerase
MARVAVTGAGGFVGRHLVAMLQKGNHEVRGLVSPNADSSSIYGTQMTSGDVRNLEVVRHLVAECDYVIHLAAHFSNDDHAVDVITTGTQHVVTVAKEAKVKRLINMSCLGAEAAGPPFHAAKWKAEMMVQSSPIPFINLRPSLIVGRGDGFVSPLADVIKSFPVVPVPGKGQHRQQPIDVDDVARCVLLAMESESLENRTVSVGGDTFVTFRQMVDLISDVLGVNKPKALLPLRLLDGVVRLLPSGTQSLYGDARLAQLVQAVVVSPGVVQREFGFEPRHVVQRLGEYF